MDARSFVDDYARYVFESPVLDDGDAVIVSWNDENDEVIVVSTPVSDRTAEVVHRSSLYELSQMHRNRLLEQRDVDNNVDIIPADLAEAMMSCKID